MAKKKTSIFIPLIFLAHFLAAQFIEKQVVYFDHNATDLNVEANAILNKVLDNIDKRQLIQITLVGHTDDEGSSSYNLALSENRSKAVFEFFASKGMDTDKLKVEFYGKEKPIVQNSDQERKWQNRRVEVFIEKRKMVVSTIFQQLKQEPQIFHVSGGAEMIIVGKEGTIIKIPMNSLMYQNSEIAKGDIEVELIEFYKKSDIVEANLHTVSNGKLLETGGMVYLSATSGGEKLKLKKGETIKISFVAEKKVEGMATFIGETQNGQMDWVRDSVTSKLVKWSTGGGSVGVKITRNNGSYTLIRKKRRRDRKKGNDRIGLAGGGGGVYNNKDSSTVKELKKVDYLLLDAGELGWINCDRFYHMENKTDLMVEMDTLYKPEVRLVFKDINSVMPARYSIATQASFQSIPIGVKATVIAFSVVNEEPYYFSKEITISKDQKENMELVKTTMSRLKEDLKKLNK